MYNLFTYICTRFIFPIYLTNGVVYIEGGYDTFLKLSKLFNCDYEAVDEMIHQTYNCSVVIVKSKHNTYYYEWDETYHAYEFKANLNHVESI